MKVLIDIQVKQLNEKENKTENENLWLSQFGGIHKYEFWLYVNYKTQVKARDEHKKYRTYTYIRSWITRYEERYEILEQIERKVKYNKTLKNWEKRFLRKWNFIDISDTSII